MRLSVAIREPVVMPSDAVSSTARKAGPRRALGWVMATVAVVALLFCVPRRAELAPVIEADNAYILLAADRLYDGLGATSIPPRAPHQPWTWRADWVFLTQWPVGYPVLICGLRWLTGMSTAPAAVTLGVVCCGVALVAWFAWARVCLPRRVPALLIAVVAAGATFSMRNLVHPASDTVLLALLPVVLLLVRWALKRSPLNSCLEGEERVPSALRIALVGFAAGAMVWVRYAAIFVPAAVGLFLLVDWCIMRRARARQVVAFAVAAVIPIAALVALNRTLGAEVSAQEQFNLGDDISWSIDPQLLATAWMHFTQQTPYAHRPEAAVFYAAVLPIAGLGIPLLWRRTRAAAWRLLASPPMVLSACVTASLLGLLIAASVLFQGKFNFVGLARYYQPIQPMYFLLFLGPLAVLPGRWLRVGSCLPLVLVCAWFVNQDARRAHARMLAKDVEVTDYGRQARHFQPNSAGLFAWLKEARGDDLVVFSNFHEEIALETGIPACPTPRDEAELHAWLDHVRVARGVDRLDVLFVLNPDNDYRDYYLDPPNEIIRRFKLSPLHDARQAPRPLIFIWDAQSKHRVQSR